MQIFGGDPFFSPGEAKAVVKDIELQPCFYKKRVLIYVPVCRDVVMQQFFPPFLINDREHLAVPVMHFI